MRHATSLALFVQPPQHLNVPARSGACTNAVPIPLAAVRTRPPQHRQVPSPSGGEARVPFPRAVALPQPLQHHQVPTLSCGVTRPLVPRAADLPQPLQPLQVPAFSGVVTQLLPRAPMRQRPPQRLQVPAQSCGARTLFCPTGTRSPWPKPAAQWTLQNALSSSRTTPPARGTSEEATYPSDATRSDPTD